MEKPKPYTRHGVVIAWVSQVEEAEQPLIDEVEPEKAMKVAGHALQRPGEIRRIADSRKHMPGDGYHEHEGCSGNWTELFPGGPRQQLAVHEQEHHRGSDR